MAADRPTAAEPIEQVQPEAIEEEEEASEETPLLSREEQDGNNDDDEVEETDVGARHANRNFSSYIPSPSQILQAFRRSGSKRKRGIRRRWPSFLALLVLCIAIICILVLAFVTPQVLKEYSTQAIQFEPTSLSILSIAESGVLARVKGNFDLDGSRVKSKPVRDWGRFSTWLAKAVESKPTRVNVSFPEYGDPVIGTAKVPGIKVDIRDRHITPLDFKTGLKPGSKDALRRVADDWIKGKLSQLKVRAQTELRLKSGIFKFPKQTISESFIFQADDVPSIPEFKIHKLDVHETDLPDGNTGLVATASIEIRNDYPVELTIPPLGFAILMPNCDPSDPQIMLGDATTGAVHIEPKKNVAIDVTGFVRRLPDAALVSCPDTHKTPLDLFLGSYMHGNETTIYVQGSDAPSLDTPRWLVDIMKGITVPVPFPGSSLDDLIKDFTIQDTHFDLPNFFADPDTPESKPRVSGNIRVLIDLPDEVNFSIDAHRVRATTNLYYRKNKFGYLESSDWQSATSRLVENGKGHEDLEVKSYVDKAPVTITDTGVFSQVLKEIVTGSNKLNLTAKANVDVDIETALGRLVVRDIPAKGDVPVNPVGHHNFSSFAPHVHNIRITDTTPDSISIAANANFTNPTPYTAIVPFVDVKIAVNDTVIGHVTARDISLLKGENNVSATVHWTPQEESGHNGTLVARELLSQYLSGYNVSITIQPHKHTLPHSPTLNKALSTLNLTLPLPHLGTPDDGEDDPDDTSPHFIRGATMHILSSTATFTLHSPLNDPLSLPSLNAKAYYKGEQVGHIVSTDPIAVPPGTSETPRLDVSWRLGSGFDAIRDALGGKLKLDAVADVRVKIGRWSEKVWFRGGGIGAKITF